MGKISGLIVGFLTTLGVCFIVAPDFYSTQMENLLFNYLILDFLTFIADDILFVLDPSLLTTVIISWASGGFVAGLLSRKLKTGVLAAVSIELVYLVLFLYPDFQIDTLTSTEMLVSIVLILFVSCLTSAVGSSLLSEKAEIGEVKISEPTLPTRPAMPTESIVIPAIKKCPSCGSTISSTATVCPYCGKPVD